jgi:hypothetical protein
MFAASVECLLNNLSRRLRYLRCEQCVKNFRNVQTTFCQNMIYYDSLLTLDFPRQGHIIFWQYDFYFNNILAVYVANTD